MREEALGDCPMLALPALVDRRTSGLLPGRTGFKVYLKRPPITKLPLNLAADGPVFNAIDP
jgi:hypothetical protein